MQGQSSAKTSYLGILDVKIAGDAKYTGMNCSCCQYAAPVQCSNVQAEGVLTILNWHEVENLQVLT